MREKYTDTTDTATTTTQPSNHEDWEQAQIRLAQQASTYADREKQKLIVEQEKKDRDLVEFLRVSVNDGYDGNQEEGFYIPLHERRYEGFIDKYSTYFEKYMTLCFKYGLMFIFVSFNFIALSISLNCNVDKPIGTRVASALFAFFFGIVYIIVNYYTYRVLHQGKICKMNKDRLFPFEI